MHWLIVLLALLGATGFSAVAQQVAPDARQTAAVSTADAQFLVFFSGGELLAVAGDTQLQVYNVSDPNRPTDAVTVPLDAPILALAGAQDFLLIAQPLDDEADELVVGGPDPYRPEGYGILNSIVIPAGTTHIAVSPDSGWALIAGAEGYVMARLADADRIQNSAVAPTGDAPLAATALTNESALLIYEGQPRLEQRALSTTLDEQDVIGTLDLPAEATALAASPGAGLAAVALEGNELALIDLDTLSISRTLALEDGPVTDMTFLTRDDRTYLALLVPERPAVMLLDLTDPAESILPGSAGLAARASAVTFAAHGGVLAVASPDDVRLFEVAPAE